MWLMTMQGKQMLARAIEIQKENGGGELTTHFLETEKPKLF